MANFEIPEWMFGPPAADPEPPQPVDPIVDREQTIADNTRAEQALNGFIAAKHNVLFEAPDAFYRATGRDAIHAAPAATQILEQLRGGLLDSLANDYQRKRLGEALDAQMQITRSQMARHVAEQNLAWQRQTAQDRIALLTKEAAYHHNDGERLEILGQAAANAARAHARVGDTPPDTEAEDASAATARSGVLGAAIGAKLDIRDLAGGAVLLDRVTDQLDPVHATPLQMRLDTLRRAEEAGADAGQPSPATPAVMSDAMPEPIVAGQQYAQNGANGGNRGARTTGAGPEFDPIRETRSANFETWTRELRRLEPQNPQLTYMATRGWRPTPEAVTSLRAELDRAQQRAATRALGDTPTAALSPTPPRTESRSDFVVLGHHPGYVNLAESMGARYFNIPPEVWQRMEPAEQWAANARFLDRIAMRGGDVLLSTRATEARSGSVFERELEYMKGHGYTVSSDGTRLIPPPTIRSAR